MGYAVTCVDGIPDCEAPQYWPPPDNQLHNECLPIFTPTHTTLKVNIKTKTIFYNKKLLYIIYLYFEHFLLFFDFISSDFLLQYDTYLAMNLVGSCFVHMDFLLDI